MSDILIILIAYLIGSLPFGLLITKLCGIPDIRKVGSGSTGATNVMRSAGLVPALLVTFLDIAKGVVAVLIATIFGGLLFGDPEYLKFISGMAAILGHVFPVFIGFHGGKGVNTALGVFIVLLPSATLIALGIFTAVVVISGYVSLGSILAALSIPIIILIEEYSGLGEFHRIYLPFTIIMAVLIIAAHRTNIRRLMNGVENKFSFHSKSSTGWQKDG